MPESRTDFAVSSNQEICRTEQSQSSEKEFEKSMKICDDIEKLEKIEDPQLWRDLLAFWILGLCNNYGYVVMLSAAHDIIKQFEHGDNDKPIHGDSDRNCNILSTGTILLADILPSLAIKIVAPFIPFWVHARVACAIGLASAGFLLVAFAEVDYVAILGVVATSISSGLGETTFLGYSSRFNKNVVSTWSSGTGGAGVIGSLSYATLTFLNISPVAIMLIMLVFPAIEAISFWVILRHPSSAPGGSKEDDGLNLAASQSMSSSINRLNDDQKSLIAFRDKMSYTIQLFKYMVPLTLVYFFEYLINQGVFELINFKNIFLDTPSQYRWLNVDYQIGVFVSRSSVNVLHLDKIWLMSVFQFINLIYFLAEAIFYVTPNIWIVFVIVFWEGLLGGGAYVNTFYRMSKDIPQNRQIYAMAIVAQADSLGIAVAGLLAIPIHNAICGLAAPSRLFTF